MALTVKLGPTTGQITEALNQNEPITLPLEDRGVTNSDEVLPMQPSVNEPQKEAGPFAEIPDLCSRIDTLIYDVEATLIPENKEKILGKLIGAMELLQANVSK